MQSTLFHYTPLTLIFRPIAALIGGLCAKPGYVMGHAGAWSGLGDGSARDKWVALEDAGVVMVDHPAKFGKTMKSLLALSSPKIVEVSLYSFHSVITFVDYRS
jgi:succinyl-CoA synthetase alpha subunit